MPRIEPFEQHPERYDHWFDEHPKAFAAEVNALRALVPREGRGVEIGVGTGRFAHSLGIAEGVDPAPAMRQRAQARDVRVQDGTAEQLPYPDGQFDYALLVTTLCFVDDLDRALAEAYRVLKPAGALVVGMIDRDHPLGQRYRARRNGDSFYRDADFRSPDEVVEAMRNVGFQGFAFRQTLFNPLNGVDGHETVATGFGEGAFVVIRGRKPAVEADDASGSARKGEGTAGREVRHNSITGRDVIVAPSRGGRPRQADVESEGEPVLTHPDCPFCVGQEERLPYVIDEHPAHDDKPWQTRVVPNKYPALTPSPPPPSASDSLFRRGAAAGRQEVIIESPVHGQALADLTVPEMEAVVATYQARCRAIRAGDEHLIPFLFRNAGPQAGASLAHPHSQLIATAHEPEAVREEEQRAKAYFQETGRCLFCDMVQRESGGPRVVDRSEGFIAFVPFAAEVPCEVMILPSVHPTDFTSMDGALRSEWARMLRRVLRSVRRACGTPDYNFYLRTSLQNLDAAPHLHWYLRLLPRTKVQAGFEVSTELRINPSSPKADAAHLRRAMA